MKGKRLYILSVLIAVGLVAQLIFVFPASAAYISQATVISTNLISGSASSISNFYYNISSLPGNSSVKIQFSRDNSNWYSSSGAAGAWDTLSATGGADLSLASLGWSGSGFYYKIQLNATSDLNQTPTVEEIHLDYVADSGSEKSFVFDNAGNVGIGTTAPSAKLEVTPSSGTGIKVGRIASNSSILGTSDFLAIDSGPGAMLLNHYTTQNIYMVDSGIGNVGIGAQSTGSKLGVTGNLSVGSSYGVIAAPAGGAIIEGNVGIGMTNPTTKLYVSGDVTAAAYHYSSDRTLKTNIKTLDNSLEKILKLRGVSFDWKKDGKESLGLIAQEVRQVYPELVGGTANNLSIQYGNLVAPLIEAIKEQQEKINTLETRIKLLEKKK